MPGELYIEIITPVGDDFYRVASPERILSHPVVAAALADARQAERERIVAAQGLCGWGSGHAARGGIDSTGAENAENAND